MSLRQGIGHRATLVRGLRSWSLSKPRTTAAGNKLFGRQLAAAALGAQPRRASTSVCHTTLYEAFISQTHPRPPTFHLQNSCDWPLPVPFALFAALQLGSPVSSAWLELGGGTSTLFDVSSTCRPSQVAFFPLAGFPRQWGAANGKDCLSRFARFFKRARAVSRG